MMNTQPHRSTRHSNESGQAAVLVAFLLFLVFLAFAALAIDGAMTYLVRRDAQNVADSAALAACRAIANNDTSINGNVTDTALNAAQNSVITHLGSLAPYASPNEGTGVGLVKGIEISTQEVRVAVMRQIPTVLTQFVGRGDSFMNAQARCDSRAGGGLMPIAVQRYDYGGSWRDYIANKDASGTSLPVAVPPPVPYASDSVTVTIPYPSARYSPSFDVPVPLPQYEASDGGPNDPQTGPIVSLVGQTAETNAPPNDMSGLILLDIRNISALETQYEFYNGVNGQANSNKDVSQGWIYQHGYPGPYPQPGSQVAILSGVSAAFGPQAMWDAGYREGDAVAAIVYDGYVWTKPDFQLTLTPNSVANGILYGDWPDTQAKAITYDVKIERAGAANARWFNPLDFSLEFSFSEASSLPAGLHVQLYNSFGTPVGTEGLSYSLTGVTDVAGWNGTLSIYGNPDITQTVQYLSGLNFLAYTSESTHGESSNFGFGSISAADYTVRTNTGKLAVRQGDTITADVYAFGDQFITSACNNVPVTPSIVGYPGPWTDFFEAVTGRVKIAKNNANKVNLTLKAQPGAGTGSHTLRFTVDASACGPARSVDIPLEITPGGVGAPGITDYVVVQGYAVFRISCINETSSTDPMKNCGPNDVWGYAISPLYYDFNDIKHGLNPRLVPWQ